MFDYDADHGVSLAMVMAYSDTVPSDCIKKLAYVCTRLKGIIKDATYSNRSFYVDLTSGIDIIMYTDNRFAGAASQRAKYSVHLGHTSRYKIKKMCDKIIIESAHV